ncbi:D-2-hydroxyacid dehydrogenase [Ruegeria sp.]|uniref:D-2-hydroxyacid dehydrogenase n=1 Tax=Ruegeria sp. TaxID=1879320 RepID=UPI00230FB0E7|nr:D-2-hydroxyacid dehydrogenase [Ruegeria sp.]MDA7965581.1 D-2-hydroxyacid dehydrogenase [Ruegeria sp.]
MKVAIYHPDTSMAGDLHDHLIGQHPELQVAAASAPDTLDDILTEAEVLLAFRPPADSLAKAANLRWLHHTSAGVDALMPARDHLNGVTVTNSSGIHSLIADYCICTILMLHWNFPKVLENQRNRNWSMFRTPPLEEFTLGIVGLGSIGKEVVRRAQGCSMNIVGMRRSGDPVPGVSQVYRPDQMAEMLPQCDFVVLATPGTAETRKLIGAPELELMKDTAFLINVGRGDVVDEAAVTHALQSGQIAGAALDVFEQEPLPDDSPLWSMENVIVTPHVSGTTSRYTERVVGKFCENLEKYRAGEPLPNIVDLDRGY